MPIGTEWEDVSNAVRRVLKTAPTILMEHEPGTVDRMRRLGLLAPDKSVVWMDGGELEVAKACIGRGESIALVAATGIPGFVDPGWEVMDHWAQHWWKTVDIEPVGMSSALDAALAVVGVDVRSFRFGGHFPEHYRRVVRFSRDPQIYYVRGQALLQFVGVVRRWRWSFRRLILLSNVRKRGMQRHWVIGPNGALPSDLKDDPKNDVVAVILGYSGGILVHTFRELYTRLRS